MCLDSSGRHSEFSLKTLGILENVTGLGEGPLDVINAVDVAQVKVTLKCLVFVMQFSE